MIKLYIITAILILLLDFIYLTAIKKYFNYQIRIIQGSDIKINYIGAILSYVFIIFGINYFIIKDKRSVFDAFLLGLVIYTIYEATNLALFKNWKLLTVLIDSIWGGILFALTTFIISKIR